MSNTLFEDSAGRLAAQADAVGRLASDAGAFSAAFAAFEARDPDAFRWVLGRLELLPRCELICEWLQIKVCVLRCVLVCGPPIVDEKLPSLADFAKAAIRLAENEQALRRAVDAVTCGDAEAWRSVIDELKLRPFCHLLCRWVCSAIWRRFCEIVCRPGVARLPDPAVDLRAAAHDLAEVVRDQKAFDAFAGAAEALDCIRTRTVLGETGLRRHCEVICWLFCVWRCHRVCRELCRLPVPILAGVQAVEEAREFALAAHQLAHQPRALADLVAAVREPDARLYGEIVERFGLIRFCWQVCGWVCSVTCGGFCICICPNPVLQPWFTTVGYFGIYSDIDAGSGKTNKSLPYPSLGTGGGPNYAFFGALQLGGFCPAISPDDPGVAMKYRFLYDAGGGPQPVTGVLVSPVLAGTRLINWPQNVAGIAGAALVTTFQDVQVVAAPAAADAAPPAVGSPWFGPGPHQIAVDPDGWVVVDADAVGGGFQVLLGFDTNHAGVAQGGDPNPVPAGHAAPAGSVKSGTDLKIIFEATRVTVATTDYTNQLDKIRVNNWLEVNALELGEFITGCCTPIDKTLTVEFTVDHEEMDSGGWSLGISSCSPSAPGDITPTMSSGSVTLSPRGGFGIIVEDTTKWENCSYTVALSTRPGLTTGLVDRGTWTTTKTFAICSH